MALRHVLACLCIAVGLPPFLVTDALPAQGRDAAALGELVEGLPVSIRVLVIGAHPDDEDTRLITWLTKGHHADVAYLSLTRGDGGQNLIGDELGDALGVIRTEELLAARRIDGAHQYFTRAYDFGFSKTAAESFEHWPHDSVLKDVVTVVRAFRPQVIVSVFSGTPRDGHGQHQVAGIVAREAFDAAMDSVRFPRAATAGYAPWTPLKFYRSRSYWRGEGATLTYNAGAYDPLLGETYAEVAARSRSQHKSQGFGVLPRPGAMVGSVRREGSRVNAPATASREHSIFDGLDTTWLRLSPLVTRPADRAAVARLERAAREVRGTLSLYEPATGLAALERMRAALSTLLADAGGTPAAGRGDLEESLRDGMARVTRAILLARGITVEATADRDEVALGDSTRVRLAVYNGGRTRITVLSPAADRDIAVRGAGSAPGRRTTVVLPDSSVVDTIWVRGDTISQPWWLATPRRGDMFSVPLDGRSDDVRDAGLQAQVMLDGGALAVRVPILRRFADPVRGEVERPLAVVPAIAVALDQTVELAPANAPIQREVRVHLTSAMDGARDVTVSLDLPNGLVADSASRQVRLDEFGAKAVVAFTVRGTLTAGAHEIAARATSGGRTYVLGYVAIEYPHIRPQKLYRPAVIDVNAVDVKLPEKLDVAYIRGVGDNVAPMLQELGVPLTVVDPSRLATTDLSRYTTIVIGTRAYEAHPELVAANPKLFDWVRRGGTLVVQYGQYEMARPGVMPYPITLARPAVRVTEEDAPVRVLHTDDPLLNAPNRIGEQDWAGWVQERSLYMPSTWDPHYRTLLSMNDPGESPNDAAVLVAPYGRGTYVYTTLSLFRQLPAGNAGGARLFANLLAAGRTSAATTNASPAHP